MSKINCITPFIPARDYELSLRFYSDLGFSKVVEIENATRLQMDGYDFWLQITDPSGVLWHIREGV